MNSGQLELALHDERKAVPWGGRSPRSLTRVQKALFLKRERQKGDRFFVDPSQIDMWLAAPRAPRIYRGAPSLLPLPRRSL